MAVSRVALLSLLFCFLSLGGVQAACDDDALAPGHAYATYNAVWEALKAGDEPQSIANVGCFLPGDLAGLDPKEAYRQFVTTAFYPNVLYDYLKAEMDRNLKVVRDQGHYREGSLAWNGAYLDETAMTAYDKTGDRRFLDLFVAYFDEVLKLRDSELGYVDAYHGRVTKSWGEYRKTWSWTAPLVTGIWVTHITHAARITYPATRFALIVHNDPALEAYRADADRFVEASRAALAEFDDDRFRIADTDWDWFNRPMTGEPEPTNHVHTYASVLVNLYALTGDEQLKTQINDIVAVFEKGVRWEPDGTVSWKYLPYFAKKGRGGNNQKEYSEPLWKASQTAPFIYRAYAAGLDVPEDLVKAITQTFLQHTLHKNRVTRNLTSKESKALDEEDPLNRASGIVTWLEYSAYDPQIADRIRDVYGTRPDIFPYGWFESGNSARGYAFFLGGD